MVRCALFASLMAVCAWISIPIPPVSFTMQTFGVFLAYLILGTRGGAASVLLYVMLGIVGLPAFSGGGGGIGAVIGPTGGFIAGWLLMAPLFGLSKRYAKGGRAIPVMCAASALLIMYVCGTLWYAFYIGRLDLAGVLSAAAVSVLPFIVPDVIKLLLAVTVSRRLSEIIKKHF